MKELILNRLALDNTTKNKVFLKIKVNTRLHFNNKDKIILINNQSKSKYFNKDNHLRLFITNKNNLNRNFKNKSFKMTITSSLSFKLLFKEFQLLNPN